MHVFRDLLVAAMEEADVGIGLGDDFAVQFQNQPQHPVGGRVGGPMLRTMRSPIRSSVSSW
jgi:hypothetical protein